MLHAGEARFEALDVLDQLRRRAGERAWRPGGQAQQQEQSEDAPHCWLREAGVHGHPQHPGRELAAGIERGEAVGA